MSKRAHLNSIMKSNFYQLQEMLIEFSNLLSESVVEQELYQLPLIKVDEVLEEPISINILNTFGNDAAGVSFLQKAFTTLKLDAFTYSTYLAHRFPGYVVLPLQIKSEVESYIDEINRRKAEFHLSVKKGYGGKRQSAHKNLHKEIENVVLLTATRKIRSCSQPINTISFYWQHKSIHKNITMEDAKLSLERAKNNPTFEYAWTDRDDKLNMIEQEIEQLSHVPKNHRIMEIKQTRAQPFIDLWTRVDGSKANKKISSSNASLPMIIFGEPPIKVNPLTNYLRENVQFKEVQHTLINGRKSWFAVPNSD
ncbi:DNA replication terminus site-binding protein [Shewanella frigidimarina]|uniref:DNA replication terminus site-binding protein n=1 Tax=Shewanella frigidimarina TaxID=56812 RepID=UPI003D7B0E26